MTLPGQTITRRDGGLGLATAQGNTFLYVGGSSAGTVNARERFSSSTKLRAYAGVGATVEAACWKLDNEGGSIDFLKVPTTVVAVTSAVVKSGAGPTITLAGTALISTVAWIEIMAGGILGAGRFRYTLDNGESYSPVLTIPSGGTYLLPSTGITATFTSGTYVLGETYAFTTTEATYAASDLTTAWAAALDSDYSWPVVVFCGHSASASAAATIDAAILTLMTAAEATFRYPRNISSCGEGTAANCLTAYASFQSAYAAQCYGTVQMLVSSKIPGWAWPRLPYAYEFARRAARVKSGTNPAWKGLPDPVCVSKLKNPSFDEFKEGETLHDSKINTMRTYQGSRGIYPVNALLKSASNSDYRYWQWGRVIDIASVAVEFSQQDFINRSVRTVVEGEDEQIGCIDPRDAAILNKEVRENLDRNLMQPTTSEGIKGLCSGYTYAVDETTKVLTTSKIVSSTRLVPFANIEEVEAELGFAQEL